jgi:hypothetical protein
MTVEVEDRYEPMTVEVEDRYEPMTVEVEDRYEPMTVEVEDRYEGKNDSLFRQGFGTNRRGRRQKPSVALG